MQTFKANWVDHSKTLREQGIVETEILTIKRKLYIGNDGNEDIDNPIQRNMQYEQVTILIQFIKILLLNNNCHLIVFYILSHI